MTETTSHAGRFVWRELMTPEPEKAIGFYGELFNWRSQPFEMGGAGTYTLWFAGEKDVAGLMASQEGEGSYWMDYITVDDVDASAGRVAELGGRILVPAMDVPTVGRIAVAMDPAGAAFGLFRGENPGSTDTESRPGIGAFCWSQLMTPNPEAVAPFYEAIFGWTRGEGANGLLLWKRGERPIATAMTEPSGHAPPHWLKYVAVAEVEPAVEKAQRLGGQVLVEPTTLPNMGRFAVLMDTTGAVFAVWKELHG